MGKLFSGAEIVFKVLEHHKVEHIFGYPGGAVLPIYDELKNHKTIKHILARHEQGAGHAAEGYARSSGKPGVLLVTSGPGATNAVTALTDAYMDSVPLVCISGQVPTHLIGTDAFQECDTTGITRPGPGLPVVATSNAKSIIFAKSFTSFTSQLCLVHGRVIPVVSHS